MSIDILPDDALREIFKLHVDNGFLKKEGEKTWQSLVHVCRRWRSIVFESPRHLGLQLVCTARTPARKMLDVWPALPLIVWCDDDSTGSANSIIALLECSDRVCQARLRNVRSSKLETFLAITDQLTSFLEQTFFSCLPPQIGRAHV